MLSPSLQYLKQFPRFIIYKTAPRAGSDKLDKVPVDFMGEPTSAHDPANWLSHEQVVHIKRMILPGDDYAIGFVITPDTKVFCLDVDGALMPNGQWHPVASTLCTMLPGAAVERSISGKGLHIWGTYTGDEPAHGKRGLFSGIGLELYTSGRFIALGPDATGILGATDSTAALHQLIGAYFSQSAGGDAARNEWAEGHQLGWALPEDEELIKLALRSAPSANSVWGNKATFAHLWNRDVAALSAAFPDPNGREFDESQADMALAAKLAWLTGNDCPRIERLMRRSGLVRAKWDSHRTYLCEFTIPRALRADDDFYNPNFYIDEQKRRREQIEENIRIGEGSNEFPTAEVLTGDEMLARYVYVAEGKRILDQKNPRRIFTLDEWKGLYKASETTFEVEGEFTLAGKPKTKTVETSRLWEKHPARREVDTVTFRPGHQEVTEDPEFKRAANTWRPVVRTAVPGDPSLFLQHVDYLFGEDASRFLDWLAHIEQKPGELPHTGWVHVSPFQGTGRNLVSCILCRVWPGYVAASFDLTKALRTGFDGRLSRKLLAVVDEINEGGSAARWENSEALKTLVTSEHRTINPKYGHESLEFNACRWLMFSNHTSALPLTGEDRRFNVVRNAKPPMRPAYYARLYALKDDAGFIAGVAHLLQSRDLSRFSAGAHAVMNEAKRDMVAASQSEADDILAELVASHPADVISNAALGPLLTGQSFGKLTPHHRHAMNRAGLQPYRKAIRIPSGVCKLSILRNHSIWKNADVDLIKAELAKYSPAAMMFGDFGKVGVN
jgi:primase-polymerase (primpol)-like protein